MRFRPAALLAPLLLPLPAAANCIPPWETHFACDIPARDARAEFCRIADTEAHPGLKEGYYSYVTGTAPAELYFQTEEIWFSTKDYILDHPTDTTTAMGYRRGDYIYAFFLTEDTREADGIRDADVRVYTSPDDFSSSTPDTEILRLHCAPSTIRANLGLIAP